MPDLSEQPWNLETFLDSLIVELDKAQDTLALKSVNRKLTYMVRDLALELMVVPRYDGNRVSFTAARPGDGNASKISLQLGSITDRQIREHSRDPASADDISIDAIDGLDESVRRSLKKVGVRSARDVDRMKDRNVDVETVVKEKTGSDRKSVDYASLARLINRARRRKRSPRVAAVSLAGDAAGPLLVVEGENLVSPLSEHATPFEIGERRGFPAALLGTTPIDVVFASPGELRLTVPPPHVPTGPQTLRIALDPYAVITMEIVP